MTDQTWSARRSDRRPRSRRLGLAAAAFDGGPSAGAVLAPDGIILAVNQAWRWFGEQNGAGVLCGPGAHYLHVTDRAARSGDDVAATAHAALTAVLAGDAPRAEVVYPCHSPTEQRWFRLHAEPLAARPDVLVVHHDVTAQVLSDLSRRSA